MRLKTNSNSSSSKQTQGGRENTSKRDLISTCVTLVVVIIIVVGGWGGLVLLMGNTSPVMLVEGNSMHSYLEDGDLVFVKSVSAHELKEEDIIVFYSQHYKKNIVHRIKDIAYDDNGNLVGFVTKGDNNIVADPGIAQVEDVNGKVVSFIRYLGKVLFFLKSQIGIALVVIIIVFLAIWSIADERNKQKKAEIPAVQSASLYPLQSSSVSSSGINPFI